MYVFVCFRPIYLFCCSFSLFRRRWAHQLGPHPVQIQKVVGPCLADKYFLNTVARIWKQKRLSVCCLLCLKYASTQKLFVCHARLDKLDNNNGLKNKTTYLFCRQTNIGRKSWEKVCLPNKIRLDIFACSDTDPFLLATNPRPTPPPPCAVSVFFMKMFFNTVLRERFPFFCPSVCFCFPSAPNLLSASMEEVLPLCVNSMMMSVLCLSARCTWHSMINFVSQ